MSALEEIFVEKVLIGGTICDCIAEELEEDDEDETA